MQVGTGKSVLNGIAIGKLKIYKKKDTAISTAPVADTAAELERFEAARQKAIEQQTALYEKALAEAGEDIAEVFNIHAMMLDDDDFVDAIKEIINGQKMCAEYAVKTAGNNQAAVFSAMDDPYLQARSADVLDGDLHGAQLVSFHSKCHEGGRIVPVEILFQLFHALFSVILNGVIQGNFLACVSILHNARSFRGRGMGPSLWSNHITFLCVLPDANV